MKVWIDQDLCTGDSLCEEIAPDVFWMGDDGLAYVMQGGVRLDDPGGRAQMADVPESMEALVAEASMDCPGECIFVELEN